MNLYLFYILLDRPKGPSYFSIGDILANSLEYPVEDPERIRVDSVFETFVCLCVCSLSVCKFSHFLYYKVL